MGLPADTDTDQPDLRDLAEEARVIRACFFEYMEQKQQGGLLGALDAVLGATQPGADCGGYASGGVPVTGTLPELGQNRSAGLRAPKWHFAGTRPARHDPRTISWDAEKIHFWERGAGDLAPPQSL